MCDGSPATRAIAEAALAESREHRVISGTLKSCVRSYDCLGSERWKFVLPGKRTRKGIARLEGSWLAIEAALNLNGPWVAQKGIAIWSYLERNTRLPGNAKYVICEDGSLAARAEIWLEGVSSEIVSKRITEAVRGLIAAFQEPAEQAVGARSCDICGGNSTLLTGLCAEAGWPYIERSPDQLQVDLDPKGLHPATIERRSSGVVISTDFGSEKGAYPQDIRGEAVGALLLKACGSLRFARAVACQETPRQNVGFEVVFADVPHPQEVGQGLAALSVASDLTSHEVEALAEDAGLAQAYLRVCSRSAASPEKRGSKTYEKA